MNVDLSAVIVNYQSVDYALGAIDTLLNDAFMIDGRPGTIEVIVVDNASRGDDVARLRALTDPRVRILANTENTGYAIANNQGFRVASGRLHLVINPDVRVVRGALSGLIDALAVLPDAGIVGPMASMDEEGEVLLPPNELPDPWREGMATLARLEPEIAAGWARRRARHAHAYWSAVEPMALDMLSGGCFLGTRAAFLQHGLFDPGYPLYYEDTDLFRRFRAAGFRLWHVPSARIVHFFSRSAITRLKAAMHRHDVSARRYHRTWFGEAGLRTHLAFRERAAKHAQDQACPWPLTELAPSTSPPTIEVGDHRTQFIEVAGNPQFSLAAGILPEHSGSFPIPSGFFRQLGAGHYWIRTADRTTGETVKAWRMTRAPG